MSALRMRVRDKITGELWGGAGSRDGMASLYHVDAVLLTLASALFLSLNMFSHARTKGF